MNSEKKIIRIRFNNIFSIGIWIRYRDFRAKKGKVIMTIFLNVLLASAKITVPIVIGTAMAVNHCRCALRSGFYTGLVEGSLFWTIRKNRYDQNPFAAGFSKTGSPNPNFLSASNCVLASPVTSQIILFVSRYLLESDLIFSTVISFTIFSLSRI